jgi:hypothetical protein
MQGRNHVSWLAVLAGSTLSLACYCSASFADCTGVKIAGDHHRGWRIAAAQGLFVFGVAGDAFAEPETQGAARFYSLSPDFKLSLAVQQSLPPSSGIEFAVSDRFIVLGLPGADTAKRTAQDLGVIQRGSAQWAQGAPVRRGGRVIVWSRENIKQKPWQLVATRPAEFSQFGAALALDGDRLAVGAPQEEKHGAVYLFDLASPGAPAQRIPAPSGVTGFGTAIRFWGDQLIVGAPEQCCQGSVLSFRQTASGWVESKRIGNPLRSTIVTYGQSLERGNTFLVVAGNGVDAGDGAPEPGAIDVYHTSELSPTSFTRLRPRDTGSAPFGNAGIAIVIGNRILVNQRTTILQFVQGVNEFREGRRISASELGVPAVYQLAATEQWVGYAHVTRDVVTPGDTWQLCTAVF